MDNGMTFSLQDMRAEDMYEDKKFSQEIELSYDAYFPRAMPSSTHKHICSDQIVEIDDMHIADKKEREEYFSKVRDYYSNKFPIGEDKYLSGGNHYHIFFPTADEVRSIECNSREIVGDMYKFIQNLPLYAKFMNVDSKKVFFNRANERFLEEEYMNSGSKRYGITAKRSYSSSNDYNNNGSVQSIEFRMNNVIHEALYGYYQASFLYSVDKNEGVIEVLNNFSALYRGIHTRFNAGGYEDGCITLEELHNKGLGIVMNKQEMKKIEHNYKIAISLLEKYGLKESANSLKSYVSEYNIFN